jgi:RNA-directed DNA polymerase
MKKMSEQVRSWRLHARTGTNLRQLAQDINPIVAGWMTY